MAAKLLRIFIGRGAAITDQQKTHSSSTDLHRKDLNTHMSPKKG